MNDKKKGIIDYILDDCKDRQFVFLKQLPIKDAPEYLLHFILCEQCSGKKYLCAVALNRYQKFQLNRSLDMIKILENPFRNYFKFNLPIKSDRIKIDDMHVTYVIYRYFEGFQDIDLSDTRPEEIMKEIYEKDSHTIEINNDTVHRICNSILSDIPEWVREKVRKSDEFERYVSYLNNYSTLEVINTHCDYSSYNIKSNDEEKLYLLDFEQGGYELPIGYDLYHYFLAKTGGKETSQIEREVPYLELNRLLWDVRHIVGRFYSKEADYVPNIELYSKNSVTKIIISSLEINELKIYKFGGFAILNMHMSKISPYVFYKINQRVFEEIKDLKILFVVNSQWSVGRMYCYTRKKVKFGGIVLRKHVLR